MITSIRQVLRYSTHAGPVYALTGSDDNQFFFSGSGDGTVVKWMIDSLDKPVATARIDGQIFSLLYLGDKEHLVVGTMSGTMHVIDLNFKKEIHCITFHQESVFDIKRYGNKIFAVSKDGSISIWSTEDYSLDKVITISTSSLRMIDFNDTKEEAAIASSDNNIYLLDLRSGKISSVLAGPSNSVFSVAFDKLHDKLLAGSRDAMLYQYDLGTLNFNKINAHLYTINHIQILGKGDCFVTASRDKTIRLWNSDTLELLKVIDKEKYNGHVNSVNRLLWLPTSNYLVSGGDDRTVIVWEIEIMNDKS
jgi:WD repeat-containing protein 61